MNIQLDVALAAGQFDALFNPTPAVGLFADTVCSSATYTVPRDSRILLCSDGAY